MGLFGFKKKKEASLSSKPFDRKEPPDFDRVTPDIPEPPEDFNMAESAPDSHSHPLEPITGPAPPGTAAQSFQMPEFPPSQDPFRKVRPRKDEVREESPAIRHAPEIMKRPEPLAPIVEEGFELPDFEEHEIKTLERIEAMKEEEAVEEEKPVPGETSKAEPLSAKDESLSKPVVKEKPREATETEQDSELVAEPQATEPIKGSEPAAKSQTTETEQDSELVAEPQEPVSRRPEPDIKYPEPEESIEYPKPEKPVISHEKSFIDIRSYVTLKEGVERVKVLSNNAGKKIKLHTEISKEKDDKYNELITALNIIQDKLILIDNKLFESNQDQR